jgi:hypothetical protein
MQVFVYTVNVSMRFIAVDIALDYRRGWAVLTGDERHGRVFFHRGNDSAFTARRDAQVTPQTAHEAHTSTRAT